MVVISRNEVNKPRRTPIIAGNWKMNKTVEEAVNLVDEMLEDLTVFQGNIEIVLIPPFLALYPIVVDVLEDTYGDIKIGAQNMYHKDNGAFTGEISPLMLREVCDYVLIGHSERRTLFSETDNEVNLKVKAAFRHDLTPIVAVGENLEIREAGNTNEHVAGQIRRGLDGIPQAEAGGLVIAYEPIWAIGTGRAATGEMANEVCAVIRQTLGEMFGTDVAGQIRIQYGGSVTPDNITEFMAQPDIDGALVGGASLKAADFVRILAKTQEVYAAKK
jgi:triosephosphate isomerase (TIM)